MCSKITKQIVQLFKAFGYSMQGLMAILKERAFKVELLLVAILLSTLFFFSVSFIEMILLIFSLIFMLTAEVINSAIETVVDRISEKKHPLSKKAKDLGSFAVFLTILNVAITWGIVFYVRF